VNAAQLNLNPLTQIEPVVIVAIALIFLATFWALRRVFVTPYLAVMEERERLFEDADDARDQADALAENAAAEAASIAQAADERIRDLREASQARQDAYAKQRLAEAGAQAATLLESGRASIASTRESQAEHVQSQAEECVAQACERLLGSTDSAVVSAAVERAVQRRRGR